MKYLKNKNLSRLVVLLLSFFLIVQNGTYSIEISAADSNYARENNSNSSIEVNKKVYEGNGYTVEFCVTNVWEDGYCVQVKIANKGETEINNWKVWMKYKADITNIWNAYITEENEEGCLFSNCGYNQNINPGEFVEFGYVCSGCYIILPEMCEMINSRAVIDEENYRVQYTLENDWDTGFSAGLCIANLSANKIENWELSFYYNRTITNIWNAEIISHEGNCYVIRNLGYNAKINANESVYVGFNGKDGQKSDTIYDYNLLGGFDCISNTHYNENVDIDIIDDDLNSVKYDVLDVAVNDLDIYYTKNDSSNCVTGNICLINEIYGIPITWSSSDEKIIDTNGTVNRPTDESTNVQMVALLKNDDNVRTKTFNLKVVKTKYEDISFNSVPIIEDFDDLLQYNNDANYFNLYVTPSGKIDIFSGSISDIIIECPKEAELALVGVKKLLGIDFVDTTIEFDQILSDNEFSFYRFYELYKGIPVEDAFVTLVTDSYGNSVALKNCLIDIDFDNIEGLTYDEVLEIINENYFNPDIDDISKVVIVNDSQPWLAWKCTYNSVNSLVSIYIDLFSGNVISSRVCDPACLDDNSRICKEKALDELGMERDVLCLETNNEKKLSDEINKISVYTGYKASSAEADEGVFPSDVIKKDIDSNTWEPAAVSAYANVLEALQYYKDNWGIKSIVHDRIGEEDWKNSDDLLSRIDDKAYLKIHVNVENSTFSDYDTNAACLYDRNVIIFGSEVQNNNIRSMGNSLSIVAHEYTHGIEFLMCPRLFADKYEREAGAILEGYADVMGLIISKSTDWCITTAWDKTLRDCRTYINYKELSTTQGKESYNSVLAHENSKVLSVAIYKMMEYGISREFIEKIIKYSLCFDYKSTSKFSDVRKSFLSSVALYQDKSLLQKAAKAFDDVGVLDSEGYQLYLKQSTCLMNGVVLKADDNRKDNEFTPLRGVKITIESEDNLSKRYVTKSDYLGRFSYNYIAGEKDEERSLSTGKYKLIFEAEGYNTAEMYVDLQASKPAFLEQIVLIPDDYNCKGQLDVNVIDVSSGENISNLSVTIRKGFYNPKGEIVTQTSRWNGDLCKTAIINTGYYTVYVEDKRNDVEEKNRYIKSCKSFVLTKSLLETGVIKVFVTKNMEKDQVRIVLEWGDEPDDLDSHIKGYYLRSDGAYSEEFEVYYHNKTYGIEGYGDEIRLDYDVRNGYGPETVTIYDVNEDKYIYYVHNYSAKYDTDAIELCKSKAVVSVFMYNPEADGRPLYTFTVPHDQHGMYWIVFEYIPKNEVNIIPVNCITDYVPIG